MAGEYSALTVAVQANTAAMERQIAQAATKSGQSAGSTIGSKIGGAFAQVGKSVTTGLTIAAGAASVFGAKVLGAGVAYNTLYQSSSKAFTTILGSQAASQKMMADLEAFGKTSPFPRQAFISGTQQMLAFGFSAKEVIPTLSAIQDTVAATGGTAQDLSEIVTVFSQIRSAGKITGEDLMQLGGRGINAAELIGKAMGESAVDIKTQITKGTLDANAALTALTGQMTKRFGGAAAGLKSTWTGAKDSVKGAMRDVGSAIAEPFIKKGGGGLAVTWANSFSKLLRATIPVVTKVVGVLTTKMGPTFANVDKIMARITEKIKAFGKEGTSGIGDLVDKALGFGKAFAPVIAGLLSLGGGKLVGALGPIGGILGSIVPGPLVAVLGTLIATSPEAQKALGALAATVTTSLAPILEQLGPLIGQVGEAAGPAFVALAEAVGQLVTAAAPLIPIVAELVTGLVTQLMPILTPMIQAFGDMTQAMGPWGVGMVAGAVGVKKLHGEVSKGITAFQLFTAEGGKLDTIKGRMGKLAQAGASAGKGISSGFSAAGKGIQSGFAAMGKGAAQAGTVSAFGESLTKNFKNVNGILGKTGYAFKAMGSGIATAGKAMAGFAASMGKAMLAFAISPFGLIIIGIVAVVALLVLLYKKSDTARKIMNAAFEGIKKAFFWLWDGAKVVVSAVIGVFKKMAPFFTTLFKIIGTVIGIYIKIIVTYFKILAWAFGIAWKIIKPILIILGEIFSAVFDVVIGLIKMWWNVVSTVFSAVGKFIASAAKTWWNVMTTVWNAIWNVVSSVVSAVWNFIVSTFSKVLAFLTPIWNAVWNVISTAWTTIRDIVSSAVETVWNVITTVFGKVAGWISSAVGAWWSAVSGAWDSITSAVSTAVEAVWNTITSVIGKVKAWIETAADNWGVTVATAWANIKTSVSDAVNAVWTTITSVFNKIKGWIAAAIEGWKIIFSTAWGYIKGVFTTAVNAIWTTISAIFTQIASWISQAVEGWKIIISTAWTAITTAVSIAVTAVRTVIATVWNTIRTVVTTAVTAVKTTVLRAFTAVSTGVSTAMGAVVRVISALWGKISGAVSSIPGKMLAFGRSIIQSLANGISRAWSVVTTALSGFGSKVTGAMKGASTLLLGVGKDVIAGLASGISGAWGAIKRAIDGIISKIPAAVRKLLGITSPSKVMAEQVGKWIPLGVAAGIEKEGSSIQVALEKALDIATGRPRVGFGPLGNVSGIAGAATGGRTVNVYPSAEHDELAIARNVDRLFGWAEASA